jgi:Kef-type K+ transport system membrane component KefB
MLPMPRLVRPALLAALPTLLLPVTLHAAPPKLHAASEPLFLAQIVALLVCARLMGEAMLRIGQPAVIGQLVGGLLLGPSILGAFSPELQHALFPGNPEQKAMVDGVAQLGIMLLLLLTGMESDLAVVRRSHRAAVSVALAGMAIPFLGGVLIGELLPSELLPDPGKRLVTALILGIALSVSSIKIIITVVREAGFLRRMVGQVMIAAAIIDDTIGWIVISTALGVCQNGQIDILSILRTIFLVVVFLLMSLTIGRRLVFLIIRWANDQFLSDVPVITTILVITGLMALITSAIGVNTVLGAFVAGILIGQSPILTRHIDEELRGLIFALFMPIFFGLAGLTTDLTTLGRPSLLLLTVTLVGVASIGKFGGVLLGGWLGGMRPGESLALGCGLNARGSTEIIVASIGLSAGAFNEGLFTAVVAMAVVTTMSMPPMLRSALARLPLAPEEARRLEREAFEARGFVANIERLLVAVDASPSGRLAARLVGLLAGARRIATTAIHLDYSTRESPVKGAMQALSTEIVLRQGIEAGDDAGREESGGVPAEVTTRVVEPASEVIVAEARKGYGLLVIGREPASERDRFHQQVTASAIDFAGRFAVVIARGIDRREAGAAPLDILVPVIGTTASRHGAELAIALAQATRGSVTALHVLADARTRDNWRDQLGASLVPASAADAIMRDIVRLGDPYGVEVKSKLRHGSTAQEVILREVESGRHNLLVTGVSPRPGQELFFGPVAAALLEHLGCSILFVAGEPLPADPSVEALRLVRGSATDRPASAAPSLECFSSLSLRRHHPKAGRCHTNRLATIGIDDRQRPTVRGRDFSQYLVPSRCR